MSEIDSVAEAPRTSVRKPPPTERDWALGEAEASAGPPFVRTVGPKMAPKAQYWAHWPQPMHRPASMDARPVSGSFAMAGQPSVVHTPQAVQASQTA